MNELSYSILRLLNVKNIGNSKAFKLIQILKNKGLSLIDLIRTIDNNKSFIELKDSINEEIYDELKNNKNSIDKYIEILKLKNIKTVNRFDENYPAILIKRLDDKTPLILFALGNYDLINETSIGFCGSRDASQKGLETIDAIIGSIDDDNLVYTSGYAKGVDLKVHQNSLEKGYKTIIVLPEGILNFRVKNEIKNIFNWNNVLVLSEFMPDSKWSVANAMQRNSTIIALSNVMILIEAKEYGGSFNAGQKALELGIPLYMPQYDNNSDHIKGNMILAEKGAKSFGKSKSTNKPVLRGLLVDLKVSKSKFNTSEPIIEQKSLFS